MFCEFDNNDFEQNLIDYNDCFSLCGWIWIFSILKIGKK